MLFRETVAVYCENHTEHINTETERDVREKNSRRVCESKKVQGKSERHFIVGREKEHRL
jgi:hypothetical protein